ncbi:hypothetical protein EON65_03140 [archaeon]|nr:MAG: hypothetical protein EON65_03140 [archaeon]
MKLESVIHSSSNLSYSALVSSSRRRHRRNGRTQARLENAGVASGVVFFEIHRFQESGSPAAMAADFPGWYV